MGKEVGGGIGMGETCEPKAFSFQCMTKFTTNKKKKEKEKEKLFVYSCSLICMLRNLPKGSKNLGDPSHSKIVKHENFGRLCHMNLIFIFYLFIFFICSEFGHTLK